MKTLRLTLFALTVCAASSFGGEVYGTITENGKPVEKGLSITITPGADNAPQQTDEFGSYRIFVPQVGACTLNLTRNKNSKETVSCPIQSYSKPTRFDLILENTNGKCTLRRQ
jgi:hypothetical protein